MPLVAPVTKSARTVHDGRRRGRRRWTGRSRSRGARTAGRTFLDVPMDAFFETRRGRAGRRTPLGAGRSRTRTPSPRSARCSPGPAPGARHRQRRLGRRGRGGGAAARRGAPGCRRSRTGWAAASSPAGTRCWSPRPAAWRSAAPTSSSSSGRPRLPARLRRVRRQGRRHAGKVVHLADSPGQVSGHADARRLRLRGPHRWSSTVSRGRARAARSKPDWSARGSTRCRTRSAAAAGATRSCSPPRPTRSTRRGSTASCSRGSPTTRS